MITTTFTNELQHSKSKWSVLQPRFYIISLILLIITMKFSDLVEQEQLVAPIQRGWETCITILSQWSAGFSYQRKEQLKCNWAYCSIAKLPLIVLIQMLYPADPSFFPHSKNHPFLVIYVHGRVFIWRLESSIACTLMKKLCLWIFMPSQTCGDFEQKFS